MPLNMIAAVAFNGVIGKGNDLPWHLQDDLKHFREITTGKIVVPGSNTQRSIMARLGRPLPHRRTIVLTSTPKNVEFQGVETTDWWQSIVKLAEREDVYVIGGAKVYAQFLPYAHELLITRVHADVQGDVFFPEWDKSQWEKVSAEPHVRDGRNEFDFTFEVYRRISGLQSIEP